jgi:hypothetical protein
MKDGRKLISWFYLYSTSKVIVNMGTYSNGSGHIQIRPGFHTTNGSGHIQIRPGFHTKWIRELI